MQVSDQSRPHFCVDHRGAASSEVDCDDSQSFVHGHHEISRPKDAALAAQRLRKRLAEGDADVLQGVVLIHGEVAASPEIQIERAVTGQQFQHVVEEADTAADPGASVTIGCQYDILGI